MTSAAKLLSCLALSAASVMAVYAQSPMPDSLSLEQCLEVALSDNPTIRMANLEIPRQKLARRETFGQLLPNVGFSTSYSRMLAKQVMYMNMDAFGSFAPGGSAGAGSSSGTEGEDPTPKSRASASAKKDNGIKMGLDNSWSTGFQASVPLVAPQLWQSLKLSDDQIALSVEQARASRLDLTQQVKNAYYALMLAEDSRRVIQESYDMARLNYETYSKQQALGAASEYDVLRTSVAMKNIEPELLQAETSVRNATRQLCLLMGMADDTPLRISGRLSQYSHLLDSPTVPDRDYSANTTLEQNALNITMLERGVKIQKAAFLPTVALSANYNWTSSNNGSPFSDLRWNPYSMIGVNISLPLYQGGSRCAAVRKAETQVSQLRLQREQLERSVAVQIDMAIDNINLSRTQYEVCTEGVRQAERARDIIHRSFDAGASTYLELRDSDMALTRARLSYYQSIYNYLTAANTLNYLQGKE